MSFVRNQPFLPESVGSQCQFDVGFVDVDKRPSVVEFGSDGLVVVEHIHDLQHKSIDSGGWSASTREKRPQRIPFVLSMSKENAIENFEGALCEIVDVVMVSSLLSGEAKVGPVRCQNS